MNRKKIFLLLILFTVLYIYMTSIDKIPEKIVLFQNEDYEINHLKGTYIEGESETIIDKILSKLTKIDSRNTGNVKLKFSALGGFFKKDIEVSVLPVKKVILGGDAVGIRLYSKGVLVIGEAPVQGIDGKYYEPYKNTNIRKGAKILKINGKRIETIVELVETVSSIEKNRAALVQYEQDGEIYEEEMNAVVSFDDGRKKLGLWVRDGAMGVGTLTFLDPDSKKIAGLGHGISDYDIKELIDVDEGYLNLATVVDVKVGKKGDPGEIRGLLNENIKLGEITLNNECGVYGNYNEESNYLRDRECVLVASRNEIELGPATIYCSVEEGRKSREISNKNC